MEEISDSNDSVSTILTENALSYIFSFLDKQSLTKSVPYVSKQWNKSFHDAIVLKRIDKLVFGKNTNHGEFSVFVKQIWSEIYSCRDWIAREIAINRTYGDNRFVFRDNNAKKMRGSQQPRCIFINNAVLDRITNGEYAMKNIFHHNMVGSDLTIMRDINSLLNLYKIVCEPSIECSNELGVKISGMYERINNLVQKLNVPSIRNIYMIVMFLLYHIVKKYLSYEFDVSFFEYSDFSWMYSISEHNNSTCNLCSIERKYPLCISSLYNLKQGDIAVSNISSLKGLCASCTECICEYLRNNVVTSNLNVSLNSQKDVVISESNNNGRVGRFWNHRLLDNIFDQYQNILNNPADVNRRTVDKKSTEKIIMRGTYKNYLEILISKYQNVFLKQNCFLKTKSTMIIEACMNDVNGFQEQCKQYYMQSKNGIILDEETPDESFSDFSSDVELNYESECDYSSDSVEPMEISY